MNLNELTIRRAHEGLRKKEFSAVDLLESCLERIVAVDDNYVNAFLSVTEDLARKQATKVDGRIKSGEEIGILEGIPIAIKDNINIAGEKTTAASKILENYIAPYDATVIKKLREVGAVLIGKTNLDEFAHGASTENSAFFTTHNPWDTQRVPGGSSGGSAAAVAASECIAALGSDTGGSIRHPAAFCGVTGLKPTYGRVSRYGLLSMTSSTDVIGPIAKNAQDAAILLSAIGGLDKKDSTTVDQPLEDYLKELDRVRGLTIGLPKEFFSKDLNPEIAEMVRRAAVLFEENGARIEEVSLPHSQYSIAIYYILTPSEISANLARYDGIRFGYQNKEAKKLFEVYAKSRGEGFGPEVKRRIMLGTYALSAGYYDAYYLQAQRVRSVIQKEVNKVLEKVDVILTPSAPHTAFKIGEQSDDPLKMYLEDIYMGLASILGLPAISVPCGFINGLPVGMQLIGRQFAERDVLYLANKYQELTDWHKQTPKI
ncbi:MAG: Asp-tRNA(Asn)/Glu-tRNA(Gln) amidotransferase subunit GatA [Patescibacteria group bacterium]|jgi:aspartyl-tRNA(Asn)/glutamyl-tRNA(Gln) amidotransferase subunit A